MRGSTVGSPRPGPSSCTESPTPLVRHFEVIGIEDLHVAGMSGRRRQLGRAVADAGLGELRRQLTYKSADLGTTAVVVNRFYPSSKTRRTAGR